MSGIALQNSPQEQYELFMASMLTTEQQLYSEYYCSTDMKQVTCTNKSATLQVT